MSTLTHFGGGLFQWVLQTTWQAAVLAGLILLAQWLLRKRLSPSWRCGLWLLLVARLLLPVPPQSAFSIFNLTKTAPTHLVTANQPPLAPAAALNEPAEIPSPNLPVVAEPRPAPAVIHAPPAATPAAKVDWFAIAFCGWLAGVCFFGVRLLWTNWRFRSRIAGYQPVADDSVTRLFNDCRAAFKIKRPVRMIESEEVESPAVYGLWRKWLLLPDGIFERFSTAELRCIFLHELAHIKRGDLGVNWLVAALRVLHWFNPVLWLAWARMRADRELATDALALAHIRESEHTSYGETILKVLEGLTGERPLPGLVGIVENKAQLKQRLAAIARPGKRWKWAALPLAGILAIMGLTCAQPDKLPRQIITLPNGDQYEFAGTTYGTNLVPPSLLCHIADHLPGGLTNLASKVFGKRLLWLKQSPPDRPELFVWFRLAKASGTAPGRVFARAGLADQNGFEVDRRALGNFINLSVVYDSTFQSAHGWNYLALANVPKRSPVLRLVFRFGTGSDIQEVTLRNPLYRPYPQWQPADALPATRDFDDLHVQVGRLEIKYRPGIYTPPAPTPNGGLSYLETFVSWPPAPGAPPNWGLMRAGLDDATGNHLDDIPPHLLYGGETGRSVQFPAGFWPGEDAWRLTLVFKRLSDFPPAASVTFRNVPIPPVGATNFVPITNSAGGVKVRIFQFTHDLNSLSARTQPPYSYIKPPCSYITVDLPEHPADMRVGSSS